VLHGPTGSVFEPLRLIRPAERQTMPAIQGGGGLVLAQVHEILLAPRRQERAEVRCRTVVDIATPRVSADELNATREPSRHLCRETVVERISDRRPPRNCARKTLWAENGVTCCTGR